MLGVSKFMELEKKTKSFDASILFGLEMEKIIILIYATFLLVLVVILEYALDSVGELFSFKDFICK